MWDEARAVKLGATIRVLRTKRGMSQEVLAARAGITKNQVALIEAGRTTGRKEDAGPANPRMATLFGLAKVLETTVSELLDHAEL